MKRLAWMLLIGLAAGASCATAAAQKQLSPADTPDAGSKAVQQERAAQAVDPKACAPDERLTRQDMRPSTPLTPGETLSNKLARTEGVLCPPQRIDPEMASPPPAGGTLRVIPPPGSPGGDPTVQPK